MVCLHDLPHGEGDMNDNVPLKRRYDALARNTEAITFPSAATAREHCNELNTLSDTLAVGDTWIVHDFVYVVRIGWQQ